jgi:hypothetical protein
MQANGGDGDSDSFAETHEGNVPGVGHELDELRTEALRAIDNGGFSCVASFSVPVFRLLTLL